MRWVVIPLAAAIAFGAAACGSEQPESSTSVYFLSPDRSSLTAVTRPGALSAREALEELLRGLRPDEARRGISTAIPSGTRVLDFRVEDGDARIHLSGLPDPRRAAERFRIITQLTKSLTGRSGVRRLWLRNRDKPWGLWRMSGGIHDGPYQQGSVCTRVGDGTPGTETTVADSFSSC
jgi:hypothetical protein